MNKHYDNIVFGASFSGIIYALLKARQGKRVLIMNKYGFPGGSVAESLNCLQKNPDLSGAPLTNQIVERLKGEKLYNFFKSQEETVLNPEAVKIILQKELEDNGLDLLFHVMPKEVKAEGGKTGLTMLAKEGELNFSCGEAFDGTGEYHLNYLNGEKRKIENAYYNLFTTASVDKTDFPDELIAESRLLEDGRFWVQLNIPGASPEFINGEAQEILNSFSGALKKGRVQLVPAQTLIDYRLDVLSKKGGVLSVEKLTGKYYKQNEEIIKAAELEKFLSENG